MTTLPSVAATAAAARSCASWNSTSLACASTTGSRTDSMVGNASSRAFGQDRRGKSRGPRLSGSAARTRGIRWISFPHQRPSAETSSFCPHRARHSPRASCASSPACRRTGTCCARRTGPSLFGCASSARGKRARWRLRRRQRTHENFPAKPPHQARPVRLHGTRTSQTHEVVERVLSHSSSFASISLTHSSVNSRLPAVLRNHITPMFIAAWQMWSSRPSSSVPLALMPLIPFARYAFCSGTTSVSLLSWSVLTSMSASG